MNRARIIFYLALGFTSLAHASVAPRQIMQVDAVRIEVTWVETKGEMAAILRQYGHRVQADARIGTVTKGFSVLGRRGGELVCLIFAPRPTRFTGDAVMTLGHELMHCLGFSHD